MMEAQTWEARRCPHYLAETSTELEHDWRLCFACRGEWRPSTTFGPMPGAEPVEIQDYDGITQDASYMHVATEATDPIEAARAEYVGREVIWHTEGVRARVESIDASGYAVLVFGSGFSILCEPDEFTIIETPVLDEEAQREVGELWLTVAARIVRAGAATFAEVDGEWHIAVAPSEYLTNDPETFWCVEMGAAYAITALAYAFGITAEQLTNLADVIENNMGIEREVTP